MQNGRENLAEYSALRDEIVATEQSRVTCKMYMYTAFFTVFTLSFSYRSLFLVSLIILLVFQSFINFYYWMIRKVSLYIKIFYENDQNKIYWESMQIDDNYKELDKEFHKYVSIWIADHAAGFLALIATFFDLYYIINGIICSGGIFRSELSLSDITLLLEIICSIVLCVAVLVVTSEVNSESKDGKISQAIQKYKESKEKLN